MCRSYANYANGRSHTIISQHFFDGLKRIADDERTIVLCNKDGVSAYDTECRRISLCKCIFLECMLYFKWFWICGDSNTHRQVINFNIRF